MCGRWDTASLRRADTPPAAARCGAAARPTRRAGGGGEAAGHVDAGRGHDLDLPRAGQPLQQTADRAGLQHGGIRPQRPAHLLQRFLHRPGTKGVSDLHRRRAPRLSTGIRVRGELLTPPRTMASRHHCAADLHLTRIARDFVVAQHDQLRQPGRPSAAGQPARISGLTSTTGGRPARDQRLDCAFHAGPADSRTASGGSRRQLPRLARAAARPGCDPPAPGRGPPRAAAPVRIAVAVADRAGQPLPHPFGQPRPRPGLRGAVAQRFQDQRPAAGSGTCSCSSRCSTCWTSPSFSTPGISSSTTAGDVLRSSSSRCSRRVAGQQFGRVLAHHLPQVVGQHGRRASAIEQPRLSASCRWSGSIHTAGAAALRDAVAFARAARPSPPPVR